jgi:hypothetical protein
VDQVHWALGGFPRRQGVAIALRSVNFNNELGSNWCLASTRYGLGNRGTPGRANDCVVAPSSAPIKSPVAPKPAAVPVRSPASPPKATPIDPFLTLTSPDPLTFSPLVNDICVQVTNTAFNPSNVTFVVNGVAQPSITFKDSNTLACLTNFSLSNGLNTVKVQYNNSIGMYDLALSRDIWAGASTVNVLLVDETGSTYTGNATVVAALSDNEFVVTNKTTCACL